MKGKRPSSLLFIVSLLSIIAINGDDSLLFANSNPDHNEDDDSVTFELFHRDSPRWPANHGKPPKSKRQLLIERHLRDLHRRNAVYSRRKDGVQLTMESGSDLGIGEYLVEVKLGNPGKKMTLVIDTGSDLTWVGCRYDCNGCHHAKNRDEFYGEAERFYKGHDDKGINIFQAHHSSTFKPIPCDSGQCRNGLRKLGSMTVCPTPMSHCMYNISYLGGEIASGFFAEEILRAPLTTTGKILKMQHLVIGCTETVVSSMKADGVMGLGFTTSSWADKIGRSFGNRFSFCMMDWSSHMNVTNFITFGRNKKSASLTPLTNIDFFQTRTGHYGVNVSGISVGGKLLNIPKRVWKYNMVTGGGMIIDSGTTNTWLAAPAYDAVMAEYKHALSKAEKIMVDPRIPFELCFKEKGVNIDSLPKLAFHFVNGGVFEPLLHNFVAEVHPGDRCVALVKANMYVGSLMGNVMMQNYMWEHNMDTKTIGFTRSNCV